MNGLFEGTQLRNKTEKRPQFPWQVTSYVTFNKIIRFGLELNWKELWKKNTSGMWSWVTFSKQQPKCLWEGNQRENEWVNGTVSSRYHMQQHYLLYISSKQGGWLFRASCGSKTPSGATSHAFSINAFRYSPSLCELPLVTALSCSIPQQPSHMSIKSGVPRMLAS